MEIIFKSPVKDLREASISHWHFEEGDLVEKGQDLVEMNCDGVFYNIPAPASGTLSEVYSETGDIVDVGEVIAKIEEE